MKEVNIEFGDYITLITGLNGTGKSSILGLAGHIFSFRENAQKLDHKTLDNKPYEAEYSELFHFCPIYDLDKNYQY
ncbi:AAA family ATPase, partial [Candidatus Woesearchaeota archaeon]|nr:AAA family ATPase [Candidatus Woesearchaeota archaeon]